MMQADPVVLRDLAPTGVVRAAINLGNSVLAQKPAGGEVAGVTADLARSLGQRLNVPVELVEFAGAGKVTEALRGNIWDIAFLAVDPARAEDLAFTLPYLKIEAAFMVARDAIYRTSAEVDQVGVRVAVGAGSAYALYLARNLRAARLVAQPTSGAAFALFVEQGLEAAAGIRDVVTAFAAKQPGLRVLADSFMEIPQAIAIAKERVAGAQYLRCFLEEMKADGQIAESLRRSGQTATILPALNG